MTKPSTTANTALKNARTASKAPTALNGKNLISVGVIRNNLKKATAEQLQLTLLSILGHAHFHGNIDPIAKNYELILACPAGLQMMSFLRKHAPVTYSAKRKEFSYVIDKADRSIILEDLPMWNAQKEDVTTLASAFGKMTEDAKAVKMTKFLARIHATTDKAALKTQEEFLKAQLKAIQADLAAPRVIDVKVEETVEATNVPETSGVAA